MFKIIKKLFIYLYFRNTICNRIKGATEGTLFPTHLNKKAVFRVFRKSFCRALPIVFRREVIASGLRGWEYSLSDDFLDTPDKNPDNECYCRKMDTCLKKGLSDLTPCYYSTFFFFFLTRRKKQFLSI